MIISKKQSDIINFLKGLLPIMVVALHTSSSATELEFFGSVESFLRGLLYKLGEAAVPAFFFISGYLFFKGLDRWNWSVWLGKLKKRVKTLFVPYILWMVIFFFGLYLWSYTKSEIPGISLSTIKASFESAGGLRMFYDRPVINGVNCLLGYYVPNDKPIDVPLWYVRDLMILFLLAPLIWAFLKFSKQYGLVLLLLTYMTGCGIPMSGFSTTGFFFLSCGAWLSMNNREFSDYLPKIRKWAYPVSILLLVASFVIHKYGIWVEDTVVKLFIISFVIALFCIADAFITNGFRPVKLLTDSSFFTYSIHNVLITEIANFLLWRVLPITAEWMLVLKVFLRPAVTVGLCLLLFVAMKKICPKTLGLLTGGRG